MQYNGFMTCKDLAFRVQDSPGPRGSLDPMSGLVLETKEELFFNDIDFLVTYLNASATKQSDMPGHAYYTKVLKFIEKHFQVGELYMEYIKMTAPKMAPLGTSALNILLEDHIFLEYQDHILVITVISCHMLLPLWLLLWEVLGPLMTNNQD